MSNANDFIIENGVLLQYNGADSTVVIPDSVTAIEQEVFAWNLSITAVVIPEHVHYIGSHAFCGCENLAAVNIPDHLMDMGESVFYDCAARIDIRLPQNESFPRVWQLVWESMNDVGGKSALLRSVLEHCYEQACHSKARQALEKNWDVVVSHLLDVNGSPALLHRLMSLCPHPDAARLRRAITMAQRCGNSELTAVLMVWENAVDDNDLTTTFDLSAAEKSDGIRGLEFTVLGELDYFLERAWHDPFDVDPVIVGFEEYLAHHGAAWGDAITLRTDYVICNRPDDYPVELERADLCGATVLSEEEFLHWVEGDWVIRDGRLLRYLGEAEDVVIPEGVHTLCSKALSRCRGMVTLTIPDHVIEMGHYVCEECENLTTVTIPRSLISLDSNEFDGCDRLTTICFPQGCPDMQEYALQECTHLQRIVFPEEDALFAPTWDALWPALQALGLVDAHLYMALADHYDALCRCEVKRLAQRRWKAVVDYAIRADAPVAPLHRLRELVPCADSNRLAHFASIASSCDRTEIAALLREWRAAPAVECPAVENETEASKRLWGLEIAVVDSSKYLTNVHSLLSLRSDTGLRRFIYTYGGIYSESVGLTTDYLVCDHHRMTEDAVCLAEYLGVPILSECEFMRMVIGGDFLIQHSVLRRYVGARHEAVIPEGVTTIGEHAFAYHAGMETVSVPTTVKWIQKCAFDGCANLVSIILPEGVQELGESAFRGCGSLISAVLPASLIDFGEDVFRDCPYLTIYAPADSLSEAYAQDYGIRFVAIES